jgi:adhesin HecA-like repeat protein
MLASDNVEITADGEINNSGFLQAEGGIQLNAQSVRNSNIIYSSGDISIDSESLNNTAGMIYSGQGDVVIKSGAVDNRQGSIFGRDVVVTAETVNNEAGGLEGYNNVVVQVISLNNKDGLIQAGSDLQLTIKDGVDPQGAINVAGTTIQWNEESNEENNDTANPEEPNDETPQPDGNSVPGREIDFNSKDEFNSWQSGSGFRTALTKLLGHSKMKTSAVLQNDDIMTYLYLTYTSGTEMTADILEAVSNQVFGLRPASEYEQNIEEVRIIAELMESCLAGNCL